MLCKVLLLEGFASILFANVDFSRFVSTFQVFSVAVEILVFGSALILWKLCLSEFTWRTFSLELVGGT